MVLKTQQQSLIPFSPLLSGLHILSGPVWKMELEDMTQVQPLQSLVQQHREAQAVPGSGVLQTRLAEGCTHLAMADRRFISRKQSPACSTSEFCSLLPLPGAREVSYSRSVLRSWHGELPCWLGEAGCKTSISPTQSFGCAQLALHPCCEKAAVGHSSPEVAEIPSHSAAGCNMTP